jgi:two-component system, OmpR family, sensor kinase
MVKLPNSKPKRRAATRSSKGSKQASKDDGQKDERERTILELREAVRARDDFIATAAHELRNPLTPVQLCIQLVRTAAQAGDHKKLEQHLTRLEGALERFLKRTATVLNVAQISTKKLHLRVSELQLSQAIRRSIDSLVPVLTLSGSALDLQIEENIVAYQDEIAVGEIVENLLSNAIKYGARRPIAVAVSKDGDFARLTVRDQGIGIEQDDIRRIFERFERTVRTTYTPGFGLGLWITRNLVEAMGGSISVTSEKGTGSLFTVSIPLNGRGGNE